MNTGNSISLSVFMKDLFSSKLKLLQGKSDSFFNNWKAKINKAEAENKEFKMSISQINTELDRLTKLRKITVDKSSFKSLSQEIDKLQLQKAKMETVGTKGSGSGIGALGMLGMAGLGIGTLYSAGRFIGSSITEYNESAQTEAQLQASLVSTGGVSGKSLTDLKSQASDLQGKTLYEDDETAAAQKILLTFTNVKNAVYDEAVPAIQDMATKMDMDLSSAALSVGKALQDPIVGVTALRRQGVMLTETQEEQIKQFVKLGQVEKAQAVILKELNKEFGGSAEAAAKAGTGGFVILANKIGNFKEAIGERITSKLSNLSKMLGKVADDATDWMEIPISEKMEEERLQVQGLVSMLTNHNITAKERNEAYTQLASLQTDVLENIDKENINVDLLTKNWKKYNEEQIKQIAFETEKKNLKDVQGKASEDLKSTVKANSKFEASLIAYMDRFPVRTQEIRNVFAKYKSGTASLDELLTTMKNSAESKYSVGGGEFASIQTMGLTAQIIKSVYDKSLKESEDGFKKYTDLQTTLGLKTGITPTKKEDNLDPEGLSTINGDISKVKNINITINRLIGIEQLTSNTAIESLSSMEDAVKKVLLTAVNDSNMAGN